MYNGRIVFLTLLIYILNLNECQTLKRQPDLSRHLCGRSQAVSSVLNGDSGEGSEFPWFVAIMDQFQTYLFAGSLMHPQIVLTAASRVNKLNPTDLSIKIGSNDLRSNLNQRKIVREIVSHPRFREETQQYDVALLILESPIDMINGISTICLQHKQEVFHKFQCKSGGWERSSTNDNTADEFALPNSLVNPTVSEEESKYVNLKLVDHDTCLSALHNTSLGREFKLLETDICAEGGGEDTCVVDDGAPLFCRLHGDDSDRYVQVGLADRSVNCGIDGLPGVYTNIEESASWIMRIATQEFGAPAYQYFIS